MMDWLLVGYLAKRRAARVGWRSPYPDYPNAEFPCGLPVEEICSVSNCIASGFHSWEETDDWNRLGLYLTPEKAWGRVPADAQADYALYAYRLWPIEFNEGDEHDIDVWWDTPTEPLAESFVRLGWDAVVGGSQSSFGCSPLSCNCGSTMVICHDLNRYCLVDNEPAALALARRFSIGEPEPGPYCVVEVWRSEPDSSAV